MSKEQAVAKLKEQSKNIRGRMEAIVAKDTTEMLCYFCRNCDALAEAIVNSDKTFQGCLTAAVKGGGKGSRDLTVFTKAVKFYLPSAEVRCEYEITVPGSPAPGGSVPDRPVEVLPARSARIDILDLL